MSKIKILFIAANPAGTPALKIDEEIRQITAKIRAAEYRDSLEVRSAWAARPDDLMQHLMEFRPHIVHFSGHGGPDGELYFLDAARDPKPASVQAIKSLFRTLRDNVKVLVFNACFASVLAEAVVEFIDCAVGMNTEVSDEAAIAFASSFYRAIGFGRSVQEAFDLGVTSILFDVPSEAATPEIMIREGVDARTLILVNLELPLGQATASAQLVPAIQNDDVDRTVLVKTLNKLLPAQLTYLMTVLNMPGSVQPGGSATHAEKVAALVNWAEAPGGCGLVRVKTELDNLIGVSGISNVATPKEEDLVLLANPEESSSDEMVESRKFPQFSYPDQRAFFSYRFSKAFPGIRAPKWFDGEQAVKRLEILLQEPLSFSDKGRGEIVPIWWFAGDWGNFQVDKFRVIENERVILGVNEFCIDKICAAYSRSYKYLFVYVQTKSLDITGLYEVDVGYLDELKRKNEIYIEEYAIFKGEHLVRREEWEDGAAEISGEIVSLDETCELRVRYITPYSFVICPHNSPINNGDFDDVLDSFLKRLLRGEDCFDELLTSVNDLPLGKY